MPEWSNGPHSKCGERVTVPGVRIPLFPQSNNHCIRRKINPVRSLQDLFFMNALPTFNPLFCTEKKYIRRQHHTLYIERLCSKEFCTCEHTAAFVTTGRPRLNDTLTYRTNQLDFYRTHWKHCNRADDNKLTYRR